MVVSLKANRKRILAFILLAAIVAGACFFLTGRGEEEARQPIPGGTNEERVAFLESFGWQVQAEPTETREVMIPAQFNDVYTAYNVMQQAQGFDPVQLYEARQAIRPGKEQEAENQAQQAYGEKYSPLLMFDSKKAVSRMLDEDAERLAVRRMVRQTQKEQQISNKGKRKNQGRDVR